MAPPNPSLDHRLDKIESMILRLAEYQSLPRPSDLTYVDSDQSPKIRGQHIEPATPATPTGTGSRVTYAVNDDRRVAGKPHAELGPV